MIKQLFYILFCFISINSFAQKEASYVIIDGGVALNFGSTNVSVENCAVIPTPQPNATASISDKDGQLLFYTDGNNVWNKNHVLMPHGTGLAGNPCGSQTVVIVPIIETNNQLFYIFTADNSGILSCDRTFPNDSLFSYSIIDMRLNNGLGDVCKKNILLLNNVNALVAAIKHSNSVDTWVITRQFTTNSFYVYKVNACGVSSPQIFDLGPRQLMYYGNTLCVSPNGKWITTTLYNSVLNTVSHFLFRFDKSTGTISSDYFNLGNSTNAVGTAFSPNSNYIYVTNFFGRLYRYDLTSDDSTTISASAELISAIPSNEVVWNLQNAIDGSIYFSKTTSNNFDAITNPDNSISQINYVPNKIPTSTIMYGRANYIADYFNPSYFSPSQEIGYPDFEIESHYCYSDTVKINFTTSFLLDSVKWVYQNQTTLKKDSSNKLDGEMVFGEKGDYNVFLHRYYKCYSDVVVKQTIIDSIYDILINDTLYFCKEKTVTINVPPGERLYVWNSDTTNSNQYIVSNEGKINIDILNACGVFSDSMEVFNDEVVMNNLITPNGDHLNDKLIIQSKSGALSEISIYNSWGSRIFYDKNYSNEWPTNSIQSGVYYYEVKVNECSYKDWVQVVH